jgi:hypothetical protein
MACRTSGKPLSVAPTIQKSSFFQLCTFQVGSFNYAMDRIVFLDEFVPTEKDRVRSILGE